MYKVEKEKCIGCQVCVQVCPGGTEMAQDGKARVVDQKKLENCGGGSICPVGAIVRQKENNPTNK